MADINLVVAFVAGLLSFFSPCILPVIPGYIAFITGKPGKDPKKHVMLHISLFILGFSLVFAIIGLAINRSVQLLTYESRLLIERVAGVFVIVFALHMLGILKLDKFLQEHRIKVKRFSNDGLTAFVFGAAFAAGWSPCVGPILGSILALAVADPGIAFPMLISYSFGLGIPFFAIGLSGQLVMKLLQKSRKALAYYNLVVGVILLLLGVLIFTDNLNLIGNIVAQCLPTA